MSLFLDATREMIAVHRMCLVSGDNHGVAAPYLDHPRPLAFAHRGGAAHNPENSWLAFEYAARLGYAYLETDARSTADGKLIAFHDATSAGRPTGTARSGSSPGGRSRPRGSAGRRRSRCSRTCSAPSPACGSTSTSRTRARSRRWPACSKRTAAWDRVCITSFSGARLLAAQRSLDRPVCLAVTPAAIARRALPRVLRHGHGPRPGAVRCAVRAGAPPDRDPRDSSGARTSSACRSTCGR